MNVDAFKEKLKEQPFSVLGDMVYQYIVNEIIEVKFSPGMAINTSKIADELGISRTPVRNALNQLADEGLVELKDGRGFRVKDIDWNDCAAVYEARKMIESTAAGIAASRITKAEIEKLRETTHMQKASRNNFSLTDWVKYDMKFHELIVHSSRNKYLIDMFEVLKRWIIRYQYVTIAFNVFDYLSDDTPLIYHSSICHALEARHATVASQQIEEHIMRLYHTVTDFPG